MILFIVFVILSLLFDVHSFSSPSKIWKTNFMGSNIIHNPLLYKSPSSLICNLKENDVDINGESQMQDQFSQWEDEEIEIYKRDLQNSIEKLKSESDSDGNSDLPDYMIKILEKFKKFNESPVETEATMASKLPILAVVGKPNTGKSTLVNKLTNSFKDGSIVHDEPGITRDRTYKTATWNDYNFQVVDTGGIIFDDSTDLFADRITEQALLALGEANAAILVCDGKEGLTQIDSVLADWLRKNNKVPLYLAVNKCESETQGISQAQEFWELGLGEPYPISSIHGTGIGDLLDIITTKHMKKITNFARENATNVAFIGRPNVGKSSLFNRLHGTNRSIVSDVAGTTRDAVDALINYKEKTYRIVDTAGIRKKGKVEYGAEFFMVNRAFKAIRRSEVVVLLLDAIDGIVEQDRILAERIAEDGRSCVIVLNKWDAIANKDDKTYLKAVENIRSQLPVLRWAEVLLVSAKTGQRTEKLFECIDTAAEQFNRRISTSVINEVVQDATMWLAPPTVGSRSGRIYYTIQVSTAPPTIVHFVNDPALFTDNYQRFLERKVRDALNFEGTPIKMIFRGKTLRDIARAAKKGGVANTKYTGNLNKK